MAIVKDDKDENLLPPAGFSYITAPLPGGGYERLKIIVPTPQKEELEEDARCRKVRYDVEDDARRKALAKAELEARTQEEQRIKSEGTDTDLDEDEEPFANIRRLAGALNWCMPQKRKPLRYAWSVASLARWTGASTMC